MNAREFALRAHGSQTYGDGKPYRVHLEEVAGNVSRFASLFSPADLETLETAAWLHDTVEDTSTTLEEIRDTFGPAVAALVSAVSNNPLLHGRELHRDTYAKIRSTGRLAAALKLCDRLANVRHSWPGDTHWPHYFADWPVFCDTLYQFDDGLEPMWDALEKLIEERTTKET
jgi:(p)ppGpp synthase/HD superfamily hydrolase